MSQKAVDSILRALIAGDQTRQNDEVGKRATQQQEEQKRQFEETMKLRIVEEKRQSEHQKATLKATQELQNLMKIERQQSLMKELEAGTPTPGVKELSRRTTPEGDTYRNIELPIFNEMEGKVYLDPTGQSNESVPTTHRLPINVEVRDPQTAARQEAARQTTLIEPQLKKQAELQAQIQSRQEVLEAIKTARAEMQENARLERQERHDKSISAASERNAKISAGARIRAAEISKAGGGLQDFDPTPWLNDIYNGRVSDVEVKRRLPKSQAEFVFKTAAEGGIVPYSDEQRDIKSDVSTAVEVLPLYDQFNKILEVNPMTGTIPETEAYKALKQIQGEIDSLLRPTSRVLGNKGAISDADAKAIETGSSPEHRFIGSIEGQLKRNKKKQEDLRKILRNAVDRKLGTLTVEQRKAVIDELGLGDNDTPAKGRPSLSDLYNKTRKP